MNQVVFRLESFSGRCPAVSPAARARDLEEAYQKGFSEGQAEAATQATDALTKALSALQSALDDHAALRREVTQQTVAELTPILQAIIRNLAQRGGASALETALQGELTRLARDMSDPDWHIYCPPDMERMIRRCASAAGLQNPDIRASATASEAVIVMEDGRSAFSTDGVADHFCDLISELQESYR